MLVFLFPSAHRIEKGFAAQRHHRLARDAFANVVGNRIWEN